MSLVRCAVLATGLCVGDTRPNVRIVVVSDLHADWMTLGVRRHPEVRKAFNQAVDAAIDEKADVFLCLGDVADPDSGGDAFHAMQMILHATLRLRRHRVRSVWIAGNHDVWEDGTGATTLTPLTPLDDDVFDGWYATASHVHVVELPRLVWLSDVHALLCLPFVAASHGVDIAQAARDLWPKTLLGGVGHAPKVIVASHLTVPGVVVGEETNEMPRGREVLYPFEETTRAVLRLQGHYHARQTFDPGDGGPPSPGSNVWRAW